MAQSEITIHQQQAANMMRVQGIISLVFGGLGALICVLFILLTAFAVTEYNDYQITSSFIMGVLVFIFGVLPNGYLIFSGIQLVNNPRPSVAKILTIINLVVGALTNLIVLIFAIISLTQSHDYEKGYSKK